MGEAAFRRLARVKQSAPHCHACLGPEMLAFFKQSVEKRQAKFGKIARCGTSSFRRRWASTAPESFSRGTLSVLVDSSSHLYELKQLLLPGCSSNCSSRATVPACGRSPSAPAAGTTAIRPPAGKLRFD